MSTPHPYSGPSATFSPERIGCCRTTAGSWFDASLLPVTETVKCDTGALDREMHLCRSTKSDFTGQVRIELVRLGSRSCRHESTVLQTGRLHANCAFDVRYAKRSVFRSTLAAGLARTVGSENGRVSLSLKSRGYVNYSCFSALDALRSRCRVDATRTLNSRSLSSIGESSFVPNGAELQLRPRRGDVQNISSSVNDFARVYVLNKLANVALFDALFDLWRLSTFQLSNSIHILRYGNLFAFLRHSFRSSLSFAITGDLFAEENYPDTNFSEPPSVLKQHPLTSLTQIKLSGRRFRCTVCSSVCRPVLLLDNVDVNLKFTQYTARICSKCI
ncbi:hypothetical protein EVAR_5304_1 [Eumeta japonica]|uniref:Uncharacterized protein n=1 Tax=Eumeta variegata TaxID=151549 RepID=A0A4C1TN69_EUMVA|nr:hypothetical protein EVAR_5304_1 [Eumeta japonica]